MSIAQPAYRPSEEGVGNFDSGLATVTGTLRRKSALRGLGFQHGLNLLECRWIFERSHIARVFAFGECLHGATQELSRPCFGQ